MRRFAQNRWLAIILALGVFLASNATLPSTSMGDGFDPIVYGGGGGGSDPGGDPDGPAGPSKRGPARGRVASGGYPYSLTSVGDGGPGVSAWVWRFQVVLRSLMSRYSRF